MIMSKSLQLAIKMLVFRMRRCKSMSLHFLPYEKTAQFDTMTPHKIIPESIETQCANSLVESVLSHVLARS